MPHRRLVALCFVPLLLSCEQDREAVSAGSPPTGAPVPIVRTSGLVAPTQPDLNFKNPYEDDKARRGGQEGRRDGARSRGESGSLEGRPQDRRGIAVKV